MSVAHPITDLPDLLATLASLNQAPAGGAGKRWPHKPLLLLLLLGRLQQTGTSHVTFDEIADDLTKLIADYAPIPNSGRASSRSRAAMPFVHLERRLWQPTWGDGTDVSTREPESAVQLVQRGAQGHLTPDVEAYLSNPVGLTAAARVLLDHNFTPTLEEPLLADVGLDLTISTGPTLVTTKKKTRDPKFAEKVLIAYDYSCAVCGFDGALGRTPVGLDAAHVHWHSQDGPDDLENAIALCVLHHRLLDRGAIGLATDRTVTVSSMFVTRSAAGNAVRALHGSPLRSPASGTPLVATGYITWHTTQVFKGAPVAA